MASFGVTAIVSVMLYTRLLNVEIAWRDAALGAIITALLFLVG